MVTDTGARGTSVTRKFRQLMRGKQLVECLTDQPTHRRVLVEGEVFQLLAHLGGGTSEAFRQSSPQVPLAF